MNPTDRVPSATIRAGKAAPRSLTWVLVFAGALALVPIGLALQPAGASNGDPAAIVEKAIDLTMTITVAKPGQPASAVSASELTDWKGGIRSKLEKYFAGGALVSLTKALGRALDDQVETGARDTGGKAKAVEILDVVVEGDTAVVNARALLWLKTQGVPGVGVVDSEAWWRYELHLSRIDGSWFVNFYNTMPEEIH